MERHLAVVELVRAPGRRGYRLSIRLDAAADRRAGIPVVDAEPAQEDGDAIRYVASGASDAVSCSEDDGWRDKCAAAAIVTASLVDEEACRPWVHLNGVGDGGTADDAELGLLHRV